jgi:N-acetylglucosaminyldiphosphoundecaprenol N-acetyl-beta-D-mannosaminyltransferase
VNFPRINVLGVKISAITMGDAIETIESWLEQETPNYICVTPAHSIMECYHDPELRSIFNRGGLTTPDGMAIVWLLQMKGFYDVERVYGPDLMVAVCRHSIPRGWRHFFYGGAPGVAALLADHLKSLFPDLHVAGSYSPPFRPLTPEEEQVIVEQVNAARPDIIWVGLGTPKQERWMAEHLGRFDHSILIGVGAAFDFLSGNKRQAPLWIQRAGLEWLFRLVSEPRRLWRRYIQYPRFLVLVVAQLLNLKQFPSE